MKGVFGRAKARRATRASYRRCSCRSTRARVFEALEIACRLAATTTPDHRDRS
jgi:hypothetical protein